MASKIISAEFVSERKEYKIKFELRSNIVVLKGDSGVGKTLLGKKLENILPEAIYFGYGDIKKLEAMLKEEYSVTQFVCKPQLIIIDNFEEVYRELPQLIEAINWDRHYKYFLIFVRESMIPIDVQVDSIGDLIFNSKSNTFSIEYVFPRREKV